MTPQLDFPSLLDISAEAEVSGGMRPSGTDVRILGLMVAFGVGVAIGTYIDSNYIAPLWN